MWKYWKIFDDFGNISEKKQAGLKSSSYCVFKHAYLGVDFTEGK